MSETSLNQFVSLIDFAYPLLTNDTFDESLSGKITGVLNNEVKTLYKLTAKETGKHVIPPFQSYMMDCFGDRNYYANLTKAELWDVLKPSKLNVEEFDYFDTLNNFSSGAYDPKYRDYESPYLATLAYMNFHMKLGSFEGNNRLDEKTFREFISDKNTKEVEFIHIDRNLKIYMKNPIKYLKEVQEMLRYNNELHFYCYHGIPFICKHVMMKYEGRSLNEIYNYCANNKSMCKFCGAEITYDSDNDDVVLNELQFSLLFTFIVSLKLMSYDNYIANLLVSILSASIKKLEITKDKGYAQKINGFVSLYLYKLYKELGIKNSDTSFVDFCKGIWNRNGWSEEQIKYSLNDTSRFLNFTEVLNTIKELKDEEKTNKNDLNSIKHVLLGRFLNENSNPIQKLFLRSPEELGKLTDMINKDTRNYTSLVEFAKILKLTETAFTKRTNQLLIIAKDAESYDEKIDYESSEDKEKQQILSKIKASATTFPTMSFDIKKLLEDGYLQEAFRFLQNIVGNVDLECNKENVLKLMNYVLDEMKYKPRLLFAELECIILPSRIRIF